MSLIRPPLLLSLLLPLAIGATPCLAQTQAATERANSNTELSIAEELTAERATALPPYLQTAQQGNISAQQAADIAQKQYGGRVLKIKPDGKVYRIKLLLDSGRVIQVTVDAYSGQLSKT